MSTFDRRRFLQLSAASATSLLLPPNSLAGQSSGHPWQNWSGNIKVTPEFFQSARTVREIADFVNGAQRIRAVGGGYSCSPCVPSTDTLLDISPLKYLLAIDYKRQQVVAGAGMTMRTLNKKLAPLGYMVQNQPEGFNASIGGCISTGAHGSGMGLGSLSDAATLAGMQIILANGTILDLNADNKKDQEILSAARLSLGSLGVISQVTLNVQPLHKLVYHARTVSQEEGLQATMWTDNDHYELCWIPHTDTFLAITRNKTTEFTPRKETLSNWWETSVTDYRRLKGLLKSANGDPEKGVEAMRTLAANLGDKKFVSRGDLSLSNQQHLRTVNMEYALPIEKVAEGLQAVREQTLESSKKDNFHLDLPVRLRFTREDNGSLLSPALGRATVYIEVASTFSLEQSGRFFRELEFRLRFLEGRPHWGKLFWKSPSKRYPEFERFRRIQQQLDPQGKFINPYIMRVLTSRDMTDLHSPLQ